MKGKSRVARCVTTISPGVPSGDRPTVAVDHLDDDVLGGDVHAARRAFVRDEAGVAAAVAVGHAAAEHARDRRALVVVQPLRRDERHPDAEVVHRDAALVGMARDVAPAPTDSRTACAAACAEWLRRIRRAWRPTFRTPAAARCAAAVAPLAQAVLRAELDRRAPDHDLRVADVDAPPARRAPLGGHVVADALLADEEDQRLAGRAAGVEAREPAGLRRASAHRCSPG